MYFSAELATTFVFQILNVKMLSVVVHFLAWITAIAGRLRPWFRVPWPSSDPRSPSSTFGWSREGYCWFSAKYLCRWSSCWTLWSCDFCPAFLAWGSDPGKFLPEWPSLNCLSKTNDCASPTGPLSLNWAGVSTPMFTCPGPWNCKNGTSLVVFASFESELLGSPR